MNDDYIIISVIHLSRHTIKKGQITLLSSNHANQEYVFRQCHKSHCALWTTQSLFSFMNASLGMIFVYFLDDTAPQQNRCGSMEVL